MARILDEPEHPVIGSLTGEVRSTDRQTDRHRFRATVRLLGTLLAYEIGRGLEGAEDEVRTPLGTRRLTRLAAPPVLATALRAGVPFLDGMLDVFRESDVMFFGASRREGAAPGSDLSMDIDLSYRALANCANRTVIWTDPMIATGSTIIAIHAFLRERSMTPARFVIAGLVGYRGAIERLETAIPGAEVFLVTCDDELDSRGYIVPGLGDAGDLSYGPKV